MALTQDDVQKSIELLSRFCRATEDEGQRRAYTQAISLLRTYLTDILPAYKHVHRASETRSERVVEIDCNGCGSHDIILNTLTTAQFSPIVISALSPNLPAVKNKSLRRGDQLIAIDSQSLSKASIKRARWLLEKSMRDGKIIQLTVIPYYTPHNAAMDEVQEANPVLSSTIELPLAAPGGLTCPLDEPDALVPTLIRNRPKPLSRTPTESRGSNRSSLHDNPRYAPSVGSRESSTQSYFAEMVGSAAHVARSSKRGSRRRKRKVYNVQLTKDSDILGIRIKASGDGGVYITKIEQDSTAHRDGQLKAGDEILTVNGKSMKGLTQSEAVDVLKGSSSSVHLVVCRLILHKDKSDNSPLTPAAATHQLAPESPLKSSATSLRSGPLSSPRSRFNSLTPNLKKSADKNATEFPFKASTLPVGRIDEGKLPETRSSVSVGDQKAPLHQSHQVVRTITEWGRFSTSNVRSPPSEPEIKTVVLVKKEGKSLGFTVCGGKGTAHRGLGIYVRTVSPSGLAAQDGRLREGDELLEVNGQSFADCTHEQAAAIIKGLKTDVMAFKLRSGPGRLVLSNFKRLPSVRGAEFSIELQKGSEGGLGLKLAELKSDQEECGVFIRKIAPGSLAFQSGLLRETDQLVELNGVSLLNMYVDEVQDLIRNLPPGAVKVKAIHPQNPKLIADLLKTSEVRQSIRSKTHSVTKPEVKQMSKQDQALEKQVAELFSEGAKSQEKLGESEVETNSMPLEEQIAQKSPGEHEPTPHDLNVSMHGNGTTADDNTLAEEGSDGESANELPMIIRQTSGGKMDSPLLELSDNVLLGDDGESGTISSISLQKELTSTTARSHLVVQDRFVQMDLMIKKSRAHAGLGVTIVASQKPIPGLHQVRRILPGGIAAKDNRLKPGDRLVSVNGVSLLNLKNTEVQKALADASKDCHLVIYRDLDFDLDASSSFTSLGSVSGSRSSIFSSEEESSPTKRFSDSYTYDLSSSHSGVITGARLGASLQHPSKRWSTGVLHDPSPLLHMTAPPTTLQGLSTELGTNREISHLSPTHKLPLSDLTNASIAEKGQGIDQSLSMEVSTSDVVVPVTPKSTSPPSSASRETAKSTPLAPPLSPAVVLEAPTSTDEEEISVTISRRGKKLGLSLEGGSGDPYIHHTQIKGLMPGGLAEKDGRLRIGDRLIAVNGKDLTGLSKQDVVGLVDEAKDQLVMVVRRKIPRTPSSLQAPRIQQPSPQLPISQFIGQTTEEENTRLKNVDLQKDDHMSGVQVALLTEPSSPPPSPPRPSTGPVVPPEPSTPPPSPPRPSTGPVVPPEPSTPPPSPPKSSNGPVVPPEPSTPPPSPPKSSNGPVVPPEPSTSPPSPPKSLNGSVVPPEPSTPPPSPPRSPTEPVVTPEPSYLTSLSSSVVQISASSPPHILSASPKSTLTKQEVTRPGSLGPVPKGSRQDHSPFEIEVNKTALGLGMTLGTDETNMILVKSLTPRSPITKDGNIRVGDHLLSVNDISLIGDTVAHAEAMISKLRNGTVRIVAMAPPRDISSDSKKVANSDTSSILALQSPGSRPDEVEGIIAVKLTRQDGEELGMEVAGGRDTPIQYIYICRLVPRSPAALCEKLRPGDQLVTCGDECLIGMTCKEARDVLRRAPSIVEITVQRKKPTRTLPSTFGTISAGVASTMTDNSRTNEAQSREIKSTEMEEEEMTVMINRRGGQKLGMKLEEGDGDQQMSCMQIKGLVPGGLIVKDGRLKIGDKLISVNGKNLKGLPKTDAVQLIDKAGEELVLIVRRLKTARSHPLPSPPSRPLTGPVVPPEPSIPSTSLPQPSTGPVVPPEPSTPPPSPPRPSTGPVVSPEPSTPPPSPPRPPSTGPVVPPEPSTPPPSPPRSFTGPVVSPEPSTPPSSPPRPPSTRPVVLPEPSTPPPSPPKSSAEPVALLSSTHTSPPSNPYNNGVDVSTAKAYENHTDGQMLLSANEEGINRPREEDKNPPTTKKLPASAAGAIDSSTDESVTATTEKGPFGVSGTVGADEEEVTVTINRKGEKKLGINLEGGSGNSQIPHIRIKELVSGGFAEKDGKLKIGDRLVSVNGKAMDGLSYKEVVQLIISAGDPIVFVVRRHTHARDKRLDNLQLQEGKQDHRAGTTEVNYSPATLARIQQKGLKVVEVNKGPLGLGMVVRGSDTKPYVPITVTDVIHLGAVDRTGKIFAGDVILKVNMESFGSISQSDARRLLKDLPQGTVKLLLKEPDSDIIPK